MHADPDVHVHEVPEEGSRVLAGREGEACVAGGVLGEGAVVQVSIEVGCVLVADVGPLHVAARCVLTDVERKEVERAVPRGTPSIGAVEDAVAVVLVAAHGELGDARG